MAAVTAGKVTYNDLPGTCWLWSAVCVHKERGFAEIAKDDAAIGMQKQVVQLGKAGHGAAVSSSVCSG